MIFQALHTPDWLEILALVLSAISGAIAKAAHSKRKNGKKDD